MRKEILIISLFFLVIFLLFSLLSYNPADPSINNATSSKNIHNLFGVAGAHIAGILIGLFGLGAFWIPVLLFLSSVHFFTDRSGRAIFLTVFGGILLIITTGSLLSLIARSDHHFIIFGTKFSSGGLLGIPFKSFLVKYSNITGAAILLFLLWLVGLILGTGFSVITFSRRVIKIVTASIDQINTATIKWRQRRKKAVKRTKAIKETASRKKRDIEIKTSVPKPIPDLPVPKQDVFDFVRKEIGYQRPSVTFLDDPEPRHASVDNENLKMQSRLLEKKLNDFGVHGSVVAVSPGPVITTFEYEPAPGVKINKIVNLSDDLALALRAISIRIVAPIPGKAVIGIEIPNSIREIVRLKEGIISQTFEKSKSLITLCLGKDIIGNPIVAELDKMPHLLIAGATGTGKSVGLNAMICSILYKATPDEVKLIMVDPKKIELSMYNGIPHLITPVVTDVKKATNALFWAVHEMERRYELLSEKKARNIKQYNQKIEKEKQIANKGEDIPEKLPLIVIIIDELADLMMVASRDVEVALTRLAQMARAAGLHLMLATQRPSVDVLTGIIKANFPTRITFQVSSKTDSRTIIDANGAENLLGNGDMLLVPPGTSKLQRVHGAFISENEVTKITDFLKAQKKPEYDETVTEVTIKDIKESEEEDHDEKYDDAIALVTKSGQASISMVQRHLRIGYNRAARIIEMMEREGVVGPSDGAKPREVLVRGYGDLPE